MTPVSGPPPPVGNTAPDRTQRERQKVAEGFERMLVEQLATTMVRSAMPEAGAYADMLPQVLTDAVVDGGGIGLGASLLPEETR
jgi:hypothetical protein